MRDDVDNTSDHRARLVVVEHTLEELKQTVSGLAKTINHHFTELSKQPRALPFKEIVATAGACLAIMVGGLSLLDSRIDKAVELALARQKQELILQQYRVDRLERVVPNTK
jgi:hypothetical protein